MMYGLGELAASELQVNKIKGMAIDERLLMAIISNCLK
jgi:hypothetical protein